LLELTPVQTVALERLVAHGFTLVAFPLYASAIGVRRNSFAALLVPAVRGGLRVLACGRQQTSVFCRTFKSVP